MTTSEQAQVPQVRPQQPDARTLPARDGLFTVPVPEVPAVDPTAELVLRIGDAVMDDHGNAARADRFRAIPVEVDALQVLPGITSRDDILALCPTANIGVPVVGGVENTLDLRWIVIDTGAGLVPVQNGDWIVSTPAGYEVLTHDRFLARFAAVADEKGKGSD